MKKILFKGAGSAVPTPFTENRINTEELKKFLKFQIERKIDALIVCGTTGESATMTKDEKIKVINCALEVSNGKVPIIAGTGSNNTKEAIEMSKTAESLGVDGLLVVTPYYNKTSQKGLIAHYKAIANNVNTPIILYNVPSRTGMNIEPETCLELSKIDNIVAIKEASRKYLSSC
jgi:dihydrodipicolinate synthase